MRYWRLYFYSSAEKIDKQKLLEIARKNAITLLKQGALPASVIVNKDKITSIKAGGKTVDELTGTCAFDVLVKHPSDWVLCLDFCKLLSKKDAEGQESVSSGSDLESNEDRAFHHPFQLKERPSSIVMNIRVGNSNKSTKCLWQFTKLIFHSRMPFLYPRRQLKKKPYNFRSNWAYSILYLVVSSIGPQVNICSSSALIFKRR